VSTYTQMQVFELFDLCLLHLTVCILFVILAEFYSEVDKKFGCMAFSLRSVLHFSTTTVCCILVLLVDI